MTKETLTLTVLEPISRVELNRHWQREGERRGVHLKWDDSYSRGAGSRGVVYTAIVTGPRK